MAAIKDTLLDKDGNEIYLKTVTDNVFDSEGNRLDNVIGSIKENLEGLKPNNKELLCYATAPSGWVTPTISHNINDYEYIMLSASVTDANIDMNPIIMPTDVFKTYTSATNYLSIRFNFGSGTYCEVDAFYINDNQVGIYAQGASNIRAKLYGLKKL